MGDMNTSYSPGSVSTATSGAPVATIDPTLVDFAKQMMALKLERAKQQQAQALAPAAPAPTFRGRAAAPVAAAAPTAGSNWGGSGPTIQQKMQQLAFRNMQNELAAKEGVAPTRMMYGPQIVMGATTDPYQMNAYQREAFLPANATGF